MTEPISTRVSRSRPKTSRAEVPSGLRRFLTGGLIAAFGIVVVTSAWGLVVLFGQPAVPETPSVAIPVAVAPAPIEAPAPILEVTLPKHDPLPVSSKPIPAERDPDPTIAPVGPPALAVRAAPVDPMPVRPMVPALVLPPNPAPAMVVADESKTQRIAFLGTVAEGKRFFFIADNSGSMNGVKMAMLKNELALTLKSLKPESQFFITFFNSEAQPLPVKDWQRGERDVPKALRWVAAVGTGGDTNPQSAFDQAFAAKPPPDVIFFMTDGQIPAHIPARMRKLNAQQPKVVIHTLLLEARNPQAMAAGLMGADLLLKQIAADSGGTYRQVVIPLPPHPVMVRPPVVIRPPLPVRRP